MKTSEISNMNYSQFVGLVRERNRPSGGLKTVQEVTVNALLKPTSKVLEIGSNTGFTTTNISLLSGCEAVGIDPNEPSVKEAVKYARQMGASKASFLVASALELPFEDQTFDLVWCSNVTSFIQDKQKAIEEYLRVLKPGGILAAVPIYYHSNPPQDIVDEVSKAIDSKIEIWDKEYWIDLFLSIGKSSRYPIEKIYDASYQYLDRSEQIPDYIKMLLAKDHLSSLPISERKVIKEKCYHFIELFNKNLQYAAYSTLLFQKRQMIDEEELFISEPLGKKD